MADAVPRDRRFAPDEEGFDDLEQLALVDRAPTQFEIDRHMRADRGRGRERLYIFRVRINGGCEFSDIGEVAQSLYSASGGAGAYRHQMPREAAHALNTRGISRRCDRALYQREVVGPAPHTP